MRVAVFSDVHSNKTGLELGLNDAFKNSVDKFVFLGDYITDGIYDNEVLDLVKKYGDYVIKGNRENYILNYDIKNEVFDNYKPLKYTYDNLSIESKSFLNILKEYEIIKIDKYKVLIIHGDNNGSFNKEFFNNLINTYDFDICLFGHTHRFLAEKYKNHYFFNPGSIGQPVDAPYYKYLILDIGENIKVNLRKINVEIGLDEYKKNYINSEYYKLNEIWGKLVIKSVESGHDYITEYLDYIKKNNESDNNFNDLWLNNYDSFIECLN